MFNNLFLAFLVTLILFPSAQAERLDLNTPLTEEMALAIRQNFGFVDLGKDEDASYFSFRDEDYFLISNLDFSSKGEAAAFVLLSQGIA